MSEMAANSANGAVPLLPKSNGDGEWSATGTKLDLLSDAFIRFNEQGMPCIISGLVTMSGTPDIDQVAQKLTVMAAEYPVYRSWPTKRAWGPMRWQTQACADFQISNHLKQVTLEIPTADDHACDRAVEAFMSETMLNPLPCEKPECGLWEMTVLTYGQKTERCDLAWRINHAVGDGVLLSTVLIGMFDEMHPEAEQTARFSRRPPPKISYCALACSVVASWNKVALQTVFPKDGASACKASPSTIGLAKTFSKSSGWDLAATKAAGRAFGCTINDLTSTVVAEALSRYCRERRDAEGEGSKLETPKTMRMLSVANTRAISVAALEREMKRFRHGEGANSFSYYFTKLPTGEMSVAERVSAVMAVFEKLKRSPEPYVVLDLNNLVRKTVGCRAVAALNKHILYRITGYMSNLPGPKVPLSFCGVPILNMCNTVTPMMFGLGISIVSYNGSVTLAISSNDGTVTHPKRLIDICDEAFRDICAVGVKVAAAKEAAETAAAAVKEAAVACPTKFLNIPGKFLCLSGLVLFLSGLIYSETF